ncbi:MAG: VOC family protein, partial [Sinobacteraceae bacterium]|nr:VOC family protein [Nevskiaceae bacterium]
MLNTATFRLLAVVVLVINLASMPTSAQTTGTVAAPQPQLLRIRMATFAAADLEVVERDYGRWLGYKVRERGVVSADLATSWGTPKAAGRAYLLMSADAAPDVYIRAVQASPAALALPYKPLLTYGWNGIEIIVDDPDGLHAKLKDSPFRVIGEPAPLGAYPSIRAFQVVGPSGEVLYLTAETGDRSRSLLPLPNGEVGRIFIMVIGGPDIEALLDFYTTPFGLTRNKPRSVPVGVLIRAQSLAPGTGLPLTTTRLAEHGNLIEFDGYSANAGPRAVPEGDLPLGIISTSFSVRSIAALQLRDTTLKGFAAPQRLPGLAYGGGHAVTLRGPAGEWVE